MGKCNEDEVKKCKKLIKKCEKKRQNCICGAKMEKDAKKEPKIHKEDLLWAYFAFRMINEVLSDPGTRDKLKAAKEDGQEAMFELATLQEALGIKRGMISPTSNSTTPPTKAGGSPPKPGTSSPTKPGTPSTSGK